MLNRLQYSIHIISICTRKQKKSFDSLYFCGLEANLKYIQSMSAKESSFTIQLGSLKARELSCNTTCYKKHTSCSLTGRSLLYKLPPILQPRKKNFSLPSNSPANKNSAKTSLPAFSFPVQKQVPLLCSPDSPILPILHHSLPQIANPLLVPVNTFC